MAHEAQREPCPDRIIDDLGGGFAMGAGGGFIYHYIMGARISERGRQLIGGFQHARINAPRIGGGFAAWGGLFSIFDCSLVYLRQKEDHYNPVMAGALTGGLLQIRKGLRAGAKGVVFGAIVLGMMEGLMSKQDSFVMEDRFREKEPQRQSIVYEKALGGGGGVGGNQLDKDLDGFLKPSPPIHQTTNNKVEGFSSWFRDLLGDRKKEDKTVVLDSFDMPTPPTPIFDYKY